jgi:dynein heavy chain
MDKILRVEKELKIIVDVLDEWVKAQKAWIYLDPIFIQADIAKQMAAEA